MLSLAYRHQIGTYRGPAAPRPRGPDRRASRPARRGDYARTSFLYAIRRGWSASGPFRPFSSSMSAWSFPAYFATP